LFWAGVGVFAVAGSFLLVRRQALKEAEPFWSPPTRRIAQAMLPALVAGFCLAVVGLLHATSSPGYPTDQLGMLWLPLGWIILYGCAFHAAGFFMPRGMKIFGWAFILGGCALLAAGLPDGLNRLDYAYAVMGVFFGLFHLAYGVYLYFTEPRRNES